MTNTNNTKNIKQHIVRIVIALIFTFLIIWGIHSLVIWIVLDFDPYFWQIDGCLDGGGRWNDAINQCDTE